MLLNYLLSVLLRVLQLIMNEYDTLVITLNKRESPSLNPVRNGLLWWRGALVTVVAGTEVTLAFK